MIGIIISNNIFFEPSLRNIKNKNLLNISNLNKDLDNEIELEIKKYKNTSQLDKILNKFNPNLSMSEISINLNKKYSFNNNSYQNPSTNPYDLSRCSFK